MSRKLHAAAAALVMALAIAPVASAATIDESLTVNSTLTVTGIPASISYGSIDPGSTSAAYPVNATVVTNAAGWQLRMSGSDFTGPATLGKINREGQIDQPPFGTSAVTSWTNFANSAFDGSSVTASGPTGSTAVNMAFRVNIPGGQAPGNYTGTITYTFSAL